MQFYRKSQKLSRVEFDDHVHRVPFLKILCASTFFFCEIDLLFFAIPSFKMVQLLKIVMDYKRIHSLHVLTFKNNSLNLFSVEILLKKKKIPQETKMTRL